MPPGRDTLAALSFVALLVGLFVLLAVTVAGANGPLHIDTAIVARIAPWRGSAVDLPMRFATYLCSWPVIVAGAVLAVAAFILRRRWQAALLVSVAVLGDQLIVYGLKTLIHRPRPDQGLALLPASGFSFPSGHTFICLAFYGLLACLAYRGVRSRALRAMIAAGVVVLTVAVGMSRIYLGAHWPTDVLGSFLLGSAWVTLLVIGADLARPRWRPPPPASN